MRKRVFSYCPALLRDRVSHAYIWRYAVGMKLSSGVQYTVRGIPPEVDIRLRQIAARRKQSLNQVIVEKLTDAAMAGKSRANFSDLVGRWTPDPAFDEIIAAQRQIDPGK